MIQSIFVALVVLGAADGGALSSTFEADFRDSQFEPLKWSMVGRSAQKFLRPTPRGLQASFTSKNQPAVPAGVAPLLQVEGDFETTLSYEILKVVRPKDDNPTGLSFRATLDSDSEYTFDVMRLFRLKDGEWLIGKEGKLVNGKRKLNLRERETKGMSGLLRMSRRGDKLRFEASEGLESDLQLLHEVTCPTNNIKQIRFFAIPSPSCEKLEVVFRTFQIKADSLILPDEPGAEESSNSWWAMIGILVGAGVIVGLCVTLGKKKAA